MERLDLYDRFNMNCVNTEDCSKCKCCDDETGDLVLCALMFGYQQGKAEAHRFIDQESYKEGYKRGLEQGKVDGKAEAFDECIKMLESEKWNYKIITKLEKLKR